MTAADLRREAEGLGVSLDETQAALLFRFLDLVYIWNRSAGLTRVERGNAERLHILDSLSVAPWIPAMGGVADLGTGGGLPGIPLAIAVPGASFTLVETNRRRVNFLQEVVRELGLGNVSVQRCDAADTVAPEGGFRCVLSRAFRNPDEFLGYALPLVHSEGSILVMAAQTTDREIEALADGVGWHVSAWREFCLPGGKELRRIFQLLRGEVPAG